MQAVPITTNVVSSNPANGEVYSIQHYVIKFVSDLTGVSDHKIWRGLDTYIELAKKDENYSDISTVEVY
jgi:hypothetical protein